MSDAGGPDVTQELRLPWDDDPGDLYEHAPCGYLTTLPDGTIVKVNETFLAWTGYARGDLVGRAASATCSARAAQIYHETHYAPLLRMQDDVHEIAFDVVCADGARAAHPGQLACSAATRPGSPRAIRTTIFNATERRGYERELLPPAGPPRRPSDGSGCCSRSWPTWPPRRPRPRWPRPCVRAPEPAFGAASSSIWLVDADRDQLVAVASTDPDHRRLRRHAALARRGRSPRWPGAATCTWSARSTEAERALPGAGRAPCAGPAATRWCCCR